MILLSYARPRVATATSKPSAGLDSLLTTSSRASSSVLVMASIAFDQIQHDLLQLNSISLNKWQSLRQPRLN